MRAEITKLQALSLEIQPLKFIPSWSLGETLYSWCCKTHRTLGTSAQQTGVALFGLPTAAKYRLMPKSLLNFGCATEGLLGASAYLLQRRTAVGAYAAFCDRAWRDRLFDSLEGLAPSTSFRSVGMTKMTRLNTLRYCLACAHADLEGGIPPRWMVEHQLPAAFTCLHHNTMLVAVEMQQGIDWNLPFDRQDEKTFAGKSAHQPVLRLLAKLSRNLLSHATVDIDALCNEALAVLMDRGVLEEGKPLNPDLLYGHIRKSALHHWLRGAFPVAQVTKQGQWMVELLEHRPRGCAVFYLLLWAFAFAEHSQRDALTAFAQAASGAAKRSRHLQLGLFEDCTLSAVGTPSQCAGNPNALCIDRPSG